MEPRSDPGCLPPYPVFLLQDPHTAHQKGAAFLSEKSRSTARYLGVVLADEPLPLSWDGASERRPSKQMRPAADQAFQQNNKELHTASSADAGGAGGGGGGGATRRIGRGESATRASATATPPGCFRYTFLLQMCFTFPHFVTIQLQSTMIYFMLILYANYDGVKGTL